MARIRVKNQYQKISSHGAGKGVYYHQFWEAKTEMLGHIPFFLGDFGTDMRIRPGRRESN